MNYQEIWGVVKLLSEGLGLSIQIFILTLIFSIPFGILVAVLQNCKIKILQILCKIYILIIRGTPAMLQIILVYFGPYYLFGISYDRFIAVIIALIINYAAYFAEIFRGGINSVSEGQLEAAYTLGLSKKRTFFRIILPQVIKKVLPALSNEVISLIKTTSLAQIIGITEMFSLAQKQASYQFSIIPLVVAGILYLILCTIITIIFQRLEKRLEYYR